MFKLRDKKIVSIFSYQAVMDPEGGQGVRANPHFETKVFNFHGEYSEKSEKNNK